MAKRELFVYWRTAADAASAAEEATATWQQQLLAANPGLSASLYRRAGEPGPSVTLMEVYSAEVELGAELESRIVEEGDRVLGCWIEGQRQVEVFERRALP